MESAHQYLDPKQLTAFVSVCEHEGFTQASQELNVTLAAISLRIKALETHLGRRLLVRGKAVRPTPAGQLLLQHIQQLRLIEAQFRENLSGRAQWQTIEIAVNADSVTSWFLPGITAALEKHRLLLNLQIEDQDHTLALLQSGQVLGCVTAQKKAIAGCIAEPLGVMQYRCVAAPALREKLRTGLNRRESISLHRLLEYQAICFNRKDALQDQFLKRQFNVNPGRYGRHFVPSVDGYHQAIMAGLGWGMEATIQHPQDVASKRVVDLFPGTYVDVALYWQHWSKESVHAARLTQEITKAAKMYLVGGEKKPTV